MPAPMIPYRMTSRDTAWQMEQAAVLLGEMNGRRSCREFSDRTVDRRVIEHAVAIAHTAPSGANRMPWRFVVVDDPAVKREIRLAAEAEERESYDRRMTPDWRNALEPLGTNWEKPFLEVAPYLVVIFRLDSQMVEGRMQRNYYPIESVGLASGFFLMTCHQLGLATLTHTPNPMNFLRDILRRPAHEKPFLLIPVGYPAEDCHVPDLPKKPLAEVLQWNASDPPGTAWPESALRE